MRKCHKIGGGLCIALFLSLFLFTLIGLNSIIEGVILDGVVLAPETQDTWAQNPGSTNTLTLRNFTFYNLTNPRDFLYRGHKPLFRETSNYLLRERFNFTNIAYSEDRSYIDFNNWLYFTPLADSRSLEEKVTVLNLAPLGFWSQLAGIDISSLAIQGFGGLFVEMNNTIRKQAIGQGVAGQYLPTNDSLRVICKGLQIEEDTCEKMYSDPIYGLEDPNNYEVWVDWSYYNNTKSEVLLYEYFNLRRIQLQSFDAIFERWSSSIDAIINNSYCSGSCTDYDLTYLQLSSSGVTRFPPTGEASDSICLTSDGSLTQNVTCQGFPELYSFHKYWFPSISNASQFQNIEFSLETVKQLYMPYNGTLLNVGNLSKLFQVGNAYDYSKSAANLKALTIETHAQSSSHAVVIWEYVKYFAYEYVLQSKDKGTKQIAGLGGVFSQALYQSFVQFADWIYVELITLEVAENIPKCEEFLLGTLGNITQKKVNSICEGISPQNYREYYRLIEPCDNEYFSSNLTNYHELLIYQANEFCNIGQLSVLNVTQQAHLDIASHYGCKGTRCTKYELAIKQFINSGITKKPLVSSIKQHVSSSTGKDWSEELQEWEYRHFLKEVYGDENYDPDTYDDEARLLDLLSFDKLFSGQMIQNLTLIQNSTFFGELFYWKNKSLLMEYIRFVTIEVGLGGLTQERTVNELLFGYEDDFLKNLKEMDTMLGGDPSIETKVALNEPNSTLQEASASPQAMYTGYSDPMITRIYKSNLGYPIITYNRTYYDGYKVVTEFPSPFPTPIPLSGTDAVQEKPLSNENDFQYIYIDSLYRIGELKFDSFVDRYGFQAMRYKIADRMLASSSDYPPNANFYQNYRGFMNLSFMGLPLFASKNHFLGCENKWEQLIEVYDERGEHPQFSNEYDETEVVMEPKSGATFVATLYLQTNLYLNQDLLFTQEARMLPIFTLYRSGNMTEDSANDLLGDLKTALAAPKKLIAFSIFGIIFTIFAMIGCKMKEGKKEKEIVEDNEPSSSNGISLLSSTNEEAIGQLVNNRNEASNRSEPRVEGNSLLSSTNDVRVVAGVQDFEEESSDED